MWRDALAIAALAGALALPAAATERHKVAMLGLTGGTGFDAKTLSTVEELLLGALESTGKFAVTGRSDIGALVGFEQQKQALGCEDNAACIAEMVGALGVEFVASGDVGKLGSVTVLTVKLIDVRTAKVAARVRRTVQNEAELATIVDGAAAELAATLDPGEPPAKVPALVSDPVSKSRGLGGVIWGAVGTAVLACGVGGYFARNVWTASSVMENAISLAEYKRATQDASRASVNANVSFALAGTAALAAVGVWVFGDSGNESDQAAHATLSGSGDGIVLVTSF